MTLSIGIAQSGAATVPFERVLTEAELALRAARAQGNGRIVPFGPRIAGAGARRSAALHTVVEAFNGDGLAVVYQPIVALDDRRICAVDAIARLRGPGGTMIDAAALGHAAGDATLARRLARHVQSRAIAEIGRLRRKGIDGIHGIALVLEVTEPQLADPDFTEALLDQLMLEGLSARDCWIGAGEGVFQSPRLSPILETLERLTAAGAECGVQGFGSGYAPLAALRRGPFAWVKLEPTLAREIAADAPAREIAAAARTIAAAIGGQVCADGVETAAIAAALSELGFDCGQGAHLCPPVTLDELEGVMRRGVAA